MGYYMDKLAYNSIISKWYMLYASSGEIYEKNDLIFLLGDDYSKSTRDNAVTALLETFRHSPIGTVLKQGIPIPSETATSFQSRDGTHRMRLLFSMRCICGQKQRADIPLRLVRWLQREETPRQKA